MTVWHKALLAKLPAYGFTPSFCKLISNFLSNRFISVVVDGTTSAFFPVSSGVRQGSVLSPTLFLLFINDILHATVSDVHSFADDSNLHKSSSFQCQPSSNARSQSRLAMSSTINSDLKSISEWGTRNLVKFNTSKTQLLTISLSNTSSNYPIIFEDSKIPPLNSINILGLQISSSLSWRDHKIAKSASKKMLFSFKNKYHYTYINTYIALYFRTPKLPVKHTNNPKKFVSIPLTLVPSLANYPLPLSPPSLGVSPSHTLTCHSRQHMKSGASRREYVCVQVSIMIFILK